jgi:hypothetical protein
MRGRHTPGGIRSQLGDLGIAERVSEAGEQQNRYLALLVDAE